MMNIVIDVRCQIRTELNSVDVKPVQYSEKTLNAEQHRHINNIFFKRRREKHFISGGVFNQDELLEFCNSTFPN